MIIKLAACAIRTGRNSINISSSFIRSAKDRRLTPDKLRLALDRQLVPLSLAYMGLDIYSDYQRALAYAVR